MFNPGSRALLTWTASTKSLMPLRSSRRPKKATRQTGLSTRSLGAWSRSAIMLGTGSLRRAGNTVSASLSAPTRDLHYVRTCLKYGFMP